MRNVLATEPCTLSIQCGANGADMDTSLILKHAHTFPHHGTLSTKTQVDPYSRCVFVYERLATPRGCFRAISRMSESALGDSIN